MERQKCLLVEIPESAGPHFFFCIVPLSPKKVTNGSMSPYYKFSRQRLLWEIDCGLAKWSIFFLELHVRCPLDVNPVSDQVLQILCFNARIIKNKL